MIAVAQWVGMAVFSSLPASVSITTAATIAQVATAATIVAEVVAIAEVSKALTPKIGGDFGTQIDFKADPRAGIPYVVGRTGVAGNIVFQQTAGSKNIYLNFGVVLTGAGPIDSFESFSANGNAVTFASDGGEGASGYYLNRMWMRRQLGETPESGYLHWSATGTKDTPSNHGGMPYEWTSAHKFSGYAGYFWGLQYNTDKYSAGPPKPLTVAKWVKVYDPRKDDTYPGGAGDHVALDESTYEWSDNPYLHALTWYLGRWQNGKRLLGVGAPLAMIDVAAFVEGANVAEANSWACGGQVYSTDDKYEVGRAFLQAGGGRPMRLGAKISCLVNTPRVSLATITGADVIGDVAVAGTTSRRNRLNTIWPKYREEAQSWELVPQDEPVSVPAYVTEDGQIRSREIEYPLVQSADQAAQLAAYDVVDGREFTPVTLPCKPQWMGYKPGDCITANEPAWGLNEQKLLILQRRRDPVTMTVTLICRSETDAKHDFALGKTGAPPSTPGLTGVDPDVVPAPDVDTWAAVGGVLAGVDGQLPAIKISGELDAAVMMIVIDYRQVLGVGDYGPWVTREYAPSTTEIHITDVIPGATYQVRVRYRNVRGVEDPTTGVDLGNVNVGGVVSSTEADTIAPAAPSALSVLGAFENFILTWTNPSDADLDKIEVWENTSNTQPNPATQAALRIDTVAALPGRQGVYSRKGLAGGATRYFWLRAVDKAGNVSAFNATSGASATLASLDFDDFAAGIKPIGRGPTNPTASTYDGDAFFNTTDGILYRKNAAGNAWINSVAATAITGQLSDSQIADIAAAKLTGQITSTQITDGAISTPKLAAGSVSTAKLAAGAVTANEIAAGSISTAKLAAGAVTANEIAANAVTATKILAGSIAASHIASATITATQIAAGTITASNLAAATITGDKIAANTIFGSHITAGAIDATQMTVATLSSITANIGTVTAGKVQNTGGTTFLDLTNSRAQFAVGSYVWRQGSIGSGVLAWFGPSSVTIGSETRTNGVFCFGTDGVTYKGAASLDSQLGGSAPAVTVNTLDAVYTGPGSGTVTNATTGTVTVTGSGGSGSYNFYWRVQCGDATHQAFATNGSAGPTTSITTAFRMSSMPIVDYLPGTATCTVIDAGTGIQIGQATINVEFANTP